ncbi:MAG: amidase [Ardenticatenaceae bacterium]|nr:amidase [Ardenticatenaceae bacterium]
MNDLCYVTAVQAIQRFKEKTLSPVELMQAVVARAEAVEPQINAFAFTYFEEAMAAAKVAEERYMRGEERPLEGIPLAVKDEPLIVGKITSNGSLLWQDNVADHNSLMVQRLLDAGAIVHARTCTPEFSIAGYTWSKLNGVTRNPWNLAMTPGGSSGGSGAALAAGTTTLATGSDIGGSIRIPASQSGVVGYKAPYGRVPEDPPFNLEYYNHSGAMARTVRDCILMQNIIAGPHPLDIASLKPKLTLPTDYEGIAGWRIAYSLDLGYQPVEDDVRENTLAALAVFRSLGATVEAVELGWTEAVHTAAMHHLGYGAMGAFLLESYHSEQRDLLTDYVKYFAELSQQVTIHQSYQAELVAGQMYASLSRVFDEYDVFICPTIAKTGVAADNDYSKDELTINGQVVDPVLGWVMTYPFNTLSRCPVLAVPSGIGAAGVPTGIQLVAPAYEDAVVFQAAMAYEGERPFFYEMGQLPNIN